MLDRQSQSHNARNHPFAIVFAAAIVSLASAAFAAPVTFNLINGDAPGEGFNDPSLGGFRVAAMNSALSIWGNILNADYAGETINVRAQFNPQGGSANAATLGSAGPVAAFSDFGSVDSAYRANTLYGSTLTNHLRRFDFDPGNPEISAVFNSDVDNATVLGNTNFYYGSSPASGSDIDFMTVALHEIGHGLNFLSFMNSSTGAYPNGTPGIYDRFLERGNGTDLVDMSDAGRAASAISNDLYWNGANAIAMNGGVRPRMYAPTTLEPGSSVSHLDEATYGNELMSPVYSGLDREPSNLERGILMDMGWDVNYVPEPAMLSLLAGGVLMLRRRRA